MTCIYNLVDHVLWVIRHKGIALGANDTSDWEMRSDIWSLIFWVFEENFVDSFTA